MCGIAGIIQKGAGNGEPSSILLERLEGALAHRGPDDRGRQVEERMAFSHLRLSIVDIAGGHQPIMGSSGRYGIIYNGEVYNYALLREDLRRKGREFRTNSDTEVILAAFEEYGAASFGMLNGMFAFCIWDRDEETAYLVRDRFGIKPLYLYEDSGRFIFASEIKAILAVPDADLTLDPAGFQDYLTFRYIQAPFTLFRRVRRVEAGTYVRIRNGIAVRHRYHDLSYDDPYPKPDAGAAKEELARRLEAAVASQLMGEVPIGVLLSGGVDSSAIACFVHRAGANLKTFNIGFPEVNEFEYSRAVARQYGLEHIEVVTTVQEMIGSLDEVVLALDEPLADPACLPLYILSRELKKHVTVVLSGEGGDELFAGYPQYRQVMESRSPYAGRYDAFIGRSWYFNDARSFLRSPLPAHELRYRKYFEEQPLLNGMLAYDMRTWMPEDLMMKADKMLMAHSLEGRFPFLDGDLFAFAAGLPMEYKLSSDGTSKWLLKEVMKSYLPASVIKRPKMGFTVPVDRLVEELRPLITDVFARAKGTVVDEVLDTGRLGALATDYYRSRKVLPLQLWTVFVLLYWFQYAFPKYREGAFALPGRARDAAGVQGR